MNQAVPADPQAANHLAEFGQLIGIPKLQLDTAGCCQLAFDGHCLVTLMYSARVRQWTLSCFLAASGATIAAGSPAPKTLSAATPPGASRRATAA